MFFFLRKLSVTSVLHRIVIIIKYNTISLQFNDDIVIRDSFVEI